MIFFQWVKKENIKFKLILFFYFFYEFKKSNLLKIQLWITPIESTLEILLLNNKLNDVYYSSKFKKTSIERTRRNDIGNEKN
jgi:hypothetical protein